MKFPIIYQNDSMQCGVACLQMVSKYFGREYSLHFLSDICFVTRGRFYAGNLCANDIVFILYVLKLPQRNLKNHFE
ncbi:cysteine peptidase family C39 domain-containing protein [Prevotella sp.]|jgi:ABC-type bacteriocin/lantibiotic exporters, contain an N-terminal double-glycine peptidase domain|uniref:cysteine peptidase family C39 domain-containing protein n=1 Tax=Prevotella sp. TaxID=59823 RepID=UPI003DA39568